MNRLATLILVVPCVIVCHAKEVVAAPSGAFSIRQEYKAGEFVEAISFRQAKVPVVALAGFEWPGLYSISPDEHWILRTQKTGSGDNMAILYRMEKTSRVMEVVGFDSLLWSRS